MSNPFDAINGAFSDLLNAIDEAKSTVEDPDPLDALEASVEALVRQWHLIAGDAADGPDPRERGDDDGVEYGDPREVW